MDDQLRELDRLAATGDAEARHQADCLRIRADEAPSWQYFIEEKQRLVRLEKQYLKDSVCREFEKFFAKHTGSGILGFRWGIFPRYDFADGGYQPDHWDIEGLMIDIDEKIISDPCQITEWGSDFEAAKLAGDLERREEYTDHLSDTQRTALIAALKDALPLAHMLDKVNRHNIGQPRAEVFDYTAKNGYRERNKQQLLKQPNTSALGGLCKETDSDV